MITSILLRRLCLLVTIHLLFTSAVFAQVEGKALHFDGENDYVQLNGGINQQLRDYTIEVWFYNDGSAPWARIFDFNNGQQKYAFLTPVHKETGTPMFVIAPEGEGSEQVIVAEAPTEPGNWYHLAITFDSEEQLGLFYLNGAVVGAAEGITATLADLGEMNSCYLGRSAFSWDPYLKGALDEFRIWNRAKSAEEINEQLVLELSGNEPGLVYYHNFNQNAVPPGGALSAQKGGTSKLHGFSQRGAPSGFGPSIDVIESRSVPQANASFNQLGRLAPAGDHFMVGTWRMHKGKDPQMLTPELSRKQSEQYGHPSAYAAYLSIPSFTDDGWVKAPTDETNRINFSVNSEIDNCLEMIDFTYFATMVEFPDSSDIKNLSLHFDKADDGARIYLFNSRYPEGVYKEGADIVLNGPATSSNLIEFLAPGEKNLLVVAQFDVCPAGNNLAGGQFKIDGKYIDESPCVDYPDKFHSEVTSIHSLNRGDRINEGQSLVSSNLKYELRLTPDGRLVIDEIIHREHCGDKIYVVKYNEVWSNQVKGRNPADDYYLVFQENDGNLCVYSEQNGFVWCSMTNNQMAAHVDLTNNGEIEIVNARGAEVWPVPDPVYKVGDTHGKEGIVFAVDPSGHHGMIVTPNDLGEYSYEDAQEAAKAYGPGWSLPNASQLRAIYENLAKEGIGNFQSAVYRATGYTTTTTAYPEAIDFSDGSRKGEHANNLATVRAVRIF